MHLHTTRQMSFQLFIAFLITGALAYFEYVGGQYTHSLALSADAAHIFLDGFAVLLAWLAVISGSRIPFLKTVCTLFNAVLLIATSCMIAWETIPLLVHPQVIIAKQTLLVAVICLILNLLILQRLTHGNHDDNIRAVTFHVLGDMISSIGVIVSSAFVALTGFNRLDSLVAVGVSIYLMSNGWSLLLKTLTTQSHQAQNE
ncbi:cation diffusion facilitator family transporter [Fodinisporobacter ferrooxydans]|uniref:Cation diffusion facilitator family transporter n=1 Tax=Fodinisporobacter ferrooxydans TaxID=2901836 RepID=A0ABY4CPE0_9BACL|nr:cation diffusion facilitator family transporter [Alicyclobacillaceae bacterium MYW30-H2]